MEKHVISKSTFVAGEQCHKLFYLNKYHDKLGISKDPISPQTQAIFKSGTAVGVLAQELFPGGVDASPSSVYAFQQSVIKTKELIDKGETVIYEAAFQYDGILAALDILVKEGEDWRAYEVKSSTRVSDTYKLDASLQYYVITNSGIKLKDILIVNINNEYVREGALDIKQLFKFSSVLNEVQTAQDSIPAKIDTLKSILLFKNPPEIKIGPHCHNPYECSFVGHCWKNIPVNSIQYIHRLDPDKKTSLSEDGIETTDQLPPDYPLNENQHIQVTSEITKKDHIDKESIKGFTDSLVYPIYHLDFESFQGPIPLLNNTKPFQQLVSQYSIHVQEKEGSLPQHKEYLAIANGSEFRPALIQKLIEDLGTQGTILVYSIKFEGQRIKEMMRDFPQFSKELEEIINRMKDLMIPFEKKWYYSHRMQGSASLKKVLPALVEEKELSYNGMTIHEGVTASNVFRDMFYGNYEGVIEQARNDLLAYCELDTMAMVKLLEKLYLAIGK